MWSLLVTFFVDSEVYLIAFSYMVSKGTSSKPQGVILTPNEYKEHLHLTQAAKFASISSIARTGNASTCLSHSFGPWILDSEASDHISGNKDLFSSLTITSPLLMIMLANESQTMGKGIDSTCPPSMLLTFILYVPNSSFNLISINKLTRDLNYLITFSDNSATLQDWSTGKMIGIGREFQGLFYLSSPSFSTHCTFMDTSLLIHCRLSHPNISKFRVMVPHFSKLSLIKCESCQLVKHTLVPFPKCLDQRTKSHFELVHTDVWGPSKIESTLRFWYFITFIIDYSHCTLLFLIKT